MPQVYMCHSGGDEEFAERLARYLRVSGGIHVWLDQWSMASGKDVWDSMEAAIKKSDVFLMVFSREFCERVNRGVGAVSKEVSMALTHSCNDPDFRFMPVVTEECNPPLRLQPVAGFWRFMRTEAEYEEELPNLVAWINDPDADVGPAVASLGSMGKTLWSVPHARNERFCGRDSELEQLERILKDHRVVVVQGLGGVGKTRLAVEYAYRMRDRYPVVMWARGSERSLMIEDYVSLAHRLALPCQGLSLDEAVAVMLNWMKTCDTPWLLIIDNVDNQEAIGDLVPRDGGNVVMTARSPVRGVFGEFLPLNPLSESAGARFLYDRSGDRDEAAARELTREIGGLPLALEQAGAFCDATGSGLGRYLELYRERRRELLDQYGPQDYPETVWTTWSMAFERIANEMPVAGDLLTLGAFLAPDPIPLDLLLAPDVVSGTDVETLGDPLTRENAVAVLRKYGLVERSGDDVVIHRLVQAVVRDRLTGELRETWESTALGMLARAFRYDSDDVTTWVPCERLRTHAEAVLRTDDGKDAEDRTLLLTNLGIHCHKSGSIKEASRWLERALAIKVREYGPDQPEVAETLVNLAMTMREQGEYARARELQEQALVIFERVYGPDHPAVALTLGNLVVTMNEQGDYRRGCQLGERALKILERVCGPDHAAVAVTLTSLGATMREQGEYERARKVFERALDIFESVHGSDHPAVASALVNLAMTMKELDDHVEGRRLLARALAVEERVYGANHPEVARTLGNIAVTMNEQGEHELASELLERALPILERVYGSDHPAVASALANLAIASKEQGDCVRSRKLFEHALLIFEHVHGLDHPLTALMLSNLALVIEEQGDYTEARRLLESALSIFERVHGLHHPAVATVLVNLAITMKKEGDHVERRRLLERALKIREQIYGLHHPDVARALCSLALTIRDQGDHGRARELLARALPIFERVHGPDHPEVARTLSNLALTIRDEGDYGQAGELLARALDIFESVQGLNHPDVTKALVNLAETFEKQGDHDRAHELLERAQAIRQQLEADSSAP